MRILGIAQKSTEYGMHRIKELVSPDIDFVFLEGFKKTDWDFIEDHGPFDGILSQCITHIPLKYRDQTVLFSLGSANRRLITKDHIRDTFIEYPTRDLWVNCNTSRKKLLKYDLDAKVMYRPNKLEVPEECPAIPNNKIILWYSCSWNGCVKKYRELSCSVLEYLKNTDIKVFMFPNNKPWVEARNICSLGKINLKELMPTTRGMVRLAEFGDFGRSNYDFCSSGKWLLNYDVDEPFAESVNPTDTPKQIFKRIRHLVDNPSMDDHIARWQYSVDHFKEDKLREHWISSIRNAFS